MVYNEIYSLSDKSIRGAINALAMDIGGYSNYDLLREGFEIDKELRFGYNYGTKVYDVITTGFAGLYLFSKRLITILDENKFSGWKTHPFFPEGKPVEMTKGLFFDMQSLDGSDIFTPENSMFTFVTERVKEVLIREMFTNLQFERITDIEMIKPATISLK